MPVTAEMEPTLEDGTPRLPDNGWTATIALIAATLSLLPLLPVSYLTLWRAEPVPVRSLPAAVFFLLITVTPLLSVIGIGAAAMALDGILTFYIGVAVTLGYLMGFIGLATSLFLFLMSQPHSGGQWGELIAAALLGVAGLVGIYYRRQKRMADAAGQAGA